MKLKEGDIVVIQRPICGYLKGHEEEFVGRIYIVEEVIETACSSCKDVKALCLKAAKCAVCSSEVRKATSREKFLFYTHGENALRGG